jgi:taurine--2-oxoglutarate transaminase
MNNNSLSKNEVNHLKTNAKAYLIQRWEPRPGYKPLILVKGKGVHFWDVDGKHYLDLISQLYNVNLGLDNQKIIDAAKKQMDGLAYAAPSYFNVPQIQLAERLAQLTPNDLCKTFFANSGTEANEAAIKLAQLYRGVSKIIGFWDAYHGSTYAAVSVGGSERNRKPGLSIFEEFKHIHSPYCYRCPYNQTYPDCNLLCADFLQYTIEKEGAKSVAAFMAEPICSWAGQVVPPDGYWQKIRKICDESEVLLIFDEVMTAFCRTGTMFACEHWNVVPDIETYAKGITSGYVPLGATIVNKKIADHFDEKGFPHSYTYSGHALACATSLAVIDYYCNENIADRVSKMGEYLRDELSGMQERIPIIGDIRGLGLFMGIELVANTETKEKFMPTGLTPEQKKLPEHNPMLYLTDTARENGLIIGATPGTGIIRMLPSFIITKEEVDEGLKLLESTLVATMKKFDLPKKK